MVNNNLAQSFPNLSNAERKKITKDFYRYLASILAESIKNLSISKKQLLKRLTVANPELMIDLYNKNKSVVLLSNHFLNWEFLITAQNILFKHQAIGIGTPLSDSVLNKLINKQRARFGMHIAHANNYKEVLKNVGKIPSAILILGDQSPSSVENAFWTIFLNQETAFYFGAEIMANQLNAEVVYVHFEHIKKGYYQIQLKLITDKPQQESYGFITQHYVKHLEADIKESPAHWLWSHKRWKINVPENILDIKARHQSRFIERFRS